MANWAVDCTEIVEALVGKDAKYSSKMAVMQDIIQHVNNLADIAFTIQCTGATPDATVEGRGVSIDTVAR